MLTFIGMVNNDIITSHNALTLQLDAVTARQAPLEVILLFVVFVGLCDGVAQGAIFGDVALLPPKYTQVMHPAFMAIIMLQDCTSSCSSCLPSA